MNEEDGFYSLQDLNVGSTLHVGGREILLYDADKATKMFLKEEFGKGN